MAPSDDQRQIWRARPSLHFSRPGEWKPALAPLAWIAYIFAAFVKEVVTHVRGVCISIGRSKTVVTARWMPVSWLAGFLLVTTALLVPADARVLSAADLERISAIRKLSIEVMTEMAMVSRRSDLSATDSDCIKSTQRTLMQVSEELQSYEYLITIESQLNDVEDDSAIRGILRFGVENALKILGTGRKRFNELSDQCSGYPLSASKTKQALQFIESIAAILGSIRPRL